jgi:hypothetical protein
MRRYWLWLALPALLVGSLLLAGEREDAIGRKVRAIEESDNKGWRKIPWTASLLEARKASAKEGQPIFLFTHDGNIDTGRC